MNSAKIENIAKRILNNELNLATLNREKYTEHQKLLLELDKEWGDKFSRKKIDVALRQIYETAIPGNIESIKEAIFQENENYSKYNIEQTVYLPVEGIQFYDEQKENPLKIGNVIFLTITKERLTKIFHKKKAFIESTKNSDKDKLYLVKESQETLKNKFLEKTCSIFRVIAEPRKAQELAIIETNKALEVLRYSISAFRDVYMGNLRVELSISGETKRGLRDTLIFSSYGSWENLERLNRPYEITSNTKEKLKKIGVFDLSDILSKPNNQRTPFEKTILRYLHWISESHIQSELENQLLTLIIALETLLGKDISSRAASILKQDSDDRKKLEQEIKRLKAFRDGTVHGSRNHPSKIEVSENDVISLREITMKLMIQALNSLKSKAIVTRQDFLSFAEIAEIKLDHKAHLQNIIDDSNRALLFIDGMKFEDFETDQKTFYAVNRAIEVIGEAVENIPEAIQNQYRNIPWKEMIRMKDKIIHQYFEVDHRIVWNVAKNELPKVKEEIQAILEELN